MEKTVMVFGVFDGLHDGHVFFIERAQKFGTNLIISVALDETVLALKNRKPSFSLELRMEALKKRFPKAVVVMGDEKLSSWLSVKKYQPDIIALGHDQILMKEALEKEKHLFKNLESIVIIEDYNRDKFSSTILRKDM